MQGSSEAELAGVRDAAANVAAEFVRFPDQFQFDLLECDALRQLQRDPGHAQLYSLLTILLTSADVRVRTCLTSSAPCYDEFCDAPLVLVGADAHRNGLHVCW